MLTDAWIIAAVVLLGLQGLSSRLLAERPLRQLAEAAATQSPADAVFSTAVARMNTGARLSVLMLAELEFLMAVKPELSLLAWSLAATLALAAVLAGTGLARPRQNRLPIG